MKKIKYSILTFSVLLCVLLCCTVTVFATGERHAVSRVLPSEPYYTEETLNVPAMNGSADTRRDLANGYAGAGSFKCTTGTTASFYTVLNEHDFGADACIINSDGAKRSAWARDLLTDTIRYANLDSIVTQGIEYYMRVSSDFLQASAFDITVRFSPDKMTKNEMMK